MWLHASTCKGGRLPDSLPSRCCEVHIPDLLTLEIYLKHEAHVVSQQGLDSHAVVVSFAEEQENLKAKATAATLWLSPPCRHSWLGIEQGVAPKYRTMYWIHSNVLEMLDVERRQVTFVSISVWTKPSERRLSGTSLRQVRPELGVVTTRPRSPREHFTEGHKVSHRPHRH